MFCTVSGGGLFDYISNRVSFWVVNLENYMGKDSVNPVGLQVAIDLVFTLEYYKPDVLGIVSCPGDS